jgi:hypothetical protein
MFDCKNRRMSVRVAAALERSPSVCVNRIPEPPGYHLAPVATALVQVISLILAALALVMGAYLLIIGRRPWRGQEPVAVAPRVRLLGVSYIIVFGSAMVQMIANPRGLAGEGLGGLMVLGGAIVIAVVLLESRAARNPLV